MRWNRAAAAGDPGKAVCQSRLACRTRKAETLEGKKKGSGEAWVADWKLENALMEPDSIKPVYFCSKLGHLSPRLV